jgi:hypothetical protein
MTTPDFRALCAELANRLQHAITSVNADSYYEENRDAVDRARAALAEAYVAEANNPPEGHPDPEPFQAILMERAAALADPDSEMSSYTRRAAARFAELDRLEEAIDFSSHGWQLTPEGEQWKQLVAEQELYEYEMGL